MPELAAGRSHKRFDVPNPAGHCSRNNMVLAVTNPSGSAVFPAGILDQSYELITNRATVCTYFLFSLLSGIGIAGNPKLLKFRLLDLLVSSGIVTTSDNRHRRLVCRSPVAIGNHIRLGAMSGRPFLIPSPGHIFRPVCSEVSELEIKTASVLPLSFLQTSWLSIPVCLPAHNLVAVYAGESSIHSGYSRTDTSRPAMNVRGMR